VAVLHDVYGSGGGRSERWSLALNAALPGAVVLHGEHERPALDGLPGARRATVIPHFIEQRQQLSRGAARELLQVDPASRVLGMVGWIHQRKNCELAIRALSLLGPDVRLWLVGAPPAADQTYLQGLLRLAAELGVSQRVLITGYVSERELELRVAALDVGLCPYREASASGSMSTLLSAHRAVVASDIALARELRELAPQAISIFGSFQPQALAAAIDAMLGRAPAPQAFDAVLADRNPALTATRYLQVLRRVASGSAGNPA
jgi:glycosyltransferase involved in cell wall biosynthesis